MKWINKKLKPTWVPMIICAVGYDVTTIVSIFK